MWCIGRITEEYRHRMYGLLEIYARPYNAQEPVVCLDEKSKQLLQQTRPPITLQPGRCAKQDYEYKRAGTRNLFVAVEPKGKRRFVEVTARRTKSDFVAFVKNLLEKVYATALTVHLVLDNLNTHFRQTFVDVLGEPAATALLERVEFPPHAQTRQLAEYGGDRNRDHGSAVHRTALRHGADIADRGTAMAATAECRRARHRMEIHPAGCRPEAVPSLCFVLSLSVY